MSLTLLQGYSSAEEEEAEERAFGDYDNSDEDGDNDVRRYESSSVFDFSASASSAKNAGLPSADDVFSQVFLLFDFDFIHLNSSNCRFP
jgi:hypothetical protein